VGGRVGFEPERKSVGLNVNFRKGPKGESSANEGMENLATKNG